MSDYRRQLVEAGASARAGMTLVEVVLSAAIAAAIAAGIGSAVMIASHAIDRKANNPAMIADARGVLEQITADMQVATVFLERTSNAVTFYVPDRNGDRQAELIRYAWSGTPGDSLTREYNGSPPAVIASDVRALDLRYLTQFIGEPPPVRLQESGEIVLICHDDAPSGSMKERELEPTKWCGTYFKPVLPTNAVSWKITRVKFRAKKSTSATETMSVQIRPATALAKPDSSILQAVLLEEHALDVGHIWVEIGYTAVSGLNPAEGYCLVIAQVTPAGRAGYVEYEENGNPMTSGAHWVTTDNSGGSWTNPVTNRDMRFYVYGTVTTEGPPTWP